MKILSLLLLFPLVLAGCATKPPRQIDNICAIFNEKPGWYKAAKKSEKRWGSSVPMMMAFIYQESRFVSKARPPRDKLLGVIPWFRKSSAYGYPQAQDGTWKWYKESTGNRGADRDDFQDAVDFIGWYNTQTKKINGVSLTNVYSLYLAYHEGHGGFKKKSYNSKNWLISIAKKVAARTKTYATQLQKCDKDFQSKGFNFWFF